jgi:hypothetical protein
MRKLIDLVCIVGFASCLIVTSLPASAEQSADPSGISIEQLQREKLELEIQELRNKKQVRHAPRSH